MASSNLLMWSVGCDCIGNLFSHMLLNYNSSILLKIIGEKKMKKITNKYGRLVPFFTLGFILFYNKKDVQ